MSPEEVNEKNKYEDWCNYDGGNNDGIRIYPGACKG